MGRFRPVRYGEQTDIGGACRWVVGSIRMATILEHLRDLWPVVIVLAAPLMLAPLWVRLIFFVIAPVVGFAIGQLGPGGPDSPIPLLLPLGGLCISIAAVLAEALARISDFIRKRVLR